MLVTSIFYSFCSVFCTVPENPIILSAIKFSNANAFYLDNCATFRPLQNEGFGGYTGITLFVHLSFQNKPWFLHVCSTSLLETLWKKEKLLITSNSSFSHSIFCPFGELSAIFIKFEIVVCKVFRFGNVQNFAFWKGLSHI